MPLAPLRNILIAASCLLAGYGSSLGFGYQRGIGWLFPILALAVLFTACWDARPRHAAYLAFLFGAGHFGWGLGWTHNSMHVYGGLPFAGAVALALLLSLALALFYAGAVWTARRLNPHATIYFALVRLVAAWTLTEHIRSWAFSGFGWLAAGYAQVPVSPLAGFIPILGTFGATALCALIAALITLSLLQHGVVRKAVPLVFIAILAITGHMLKSVSYTTVSGPEFQVSMLQGAIPQQQQWLQDNITKVPSLYLDLAEQATGHLLIAPETALPFNWEAMQGKPVDAFLELSTRKDAILVMGTFTKDPATDQSRNSAVVFGPDTSYIYSKQHLTPYGEYLPFAGLLEPLLQRAQIPYANLVPGAKQNALELPFATIVMTICYESLFPGLFLDPTAELFVNITNDSWFDGTAMPSQHLQIAAARALEYGRSLVRVANTGTSAVIQPNGRIGSWIAPGIRAQKTHTVEPRQGATPYGFGGDLPVLLVAFFLLAWRPRNQYAS